MAAESKDLFAFRRGFTDLLPNRSLDYARDDSLVRNLKQLVKLQFADLSNADTFIFHSPAQNDPVGFRAHRVIAIRSVITAPRGNN